eukprot:CAMPEP_0198354538 /NCGR_PEP_ID=MMETSP1450-20131203/115723_1 /TAXON_ID=753684 ORGANISM="Madagascaria erythrocladiodes, Strain CCMP3234" /NCGR_SAMPLE_ID=MMETSP1450 /ASSEMBLY_ACC=CAM_ASM_001115 /LENGTH=77 /DNA_ID=CAMNT_0044060823 /DNA_START=116 /DNA_END=345 /DNA_ORIENTATION=-
MFRPKSILPPQQSQRNLAASSQVIVSLSSHLWRSCLDAGSPAPFSIVGMMGTTKFLFLSKCALERACSFACKTAQAG